MTTPPEIRVTNESPTHDERVTHNGLTSHPRGDKRVTVSIPTTKAAKLKKPVKPRFPHAETGKTDFFSSESLEADKKRRVQPRRRASSAMPRPAAADNPLVAKLRKFGLASAATLFRKHGEKWCRDLIAALYDELNAGRSIESVLISAKSYAAHPQSLYPEEIDEDALRRDAELAALDEVGCLGNVPYGQVVRRMSDMKAHGCSTREINLALRKMFAAANQEPEPRIPPRRKLSKKERAEIERREQKEWENDPGLSCYDDE